MDMDHNQLEGITPLGTPFEDDHTAYKQGVGSSVDPSAGVHTINFHPPLHGVIGNKPNHSQHRSPNTIAANQMH
jgi:hypothetical protein